MKIDFCIKQVWGSSETKTNFFYGFYYIFSACLFTYCNSTWFRLDALTVWICVMSDEKEHHLMNKDCLLPVNRGSNRRRVLWRRTSEKPCTPLWIRSLVEDLKFLNDSNSCRICQTFLICQIKTPVTSNNSRKNRVYFTVIPQLLSKGHRRVCCVSVYSEKMKNFTKKMKRSWILKETRSATEWCSC
jgi:hypothetical protein